MAISATLQLSDGGVLAAVKENLIDIYTVLKLDYTVERSCDKTGRPSGGPKISVINVTIRAAKQKGTPFHDWIKGEDKLMDGVIKIYDSAGILSSTIQDATGTDTLVDVSEAFDIPNDMMGGAMGEAMDQASKYGTPDDLYEEMSHKELVDFTTQEGITIESGDTDDAIREKIRLKKETDDRYDELKKASDALKTADDVEKFKKKYPEISWPTADDVSTMTSAELNEYIKSIQKMANEETDRKKDIGKSIQKSKELQKKAFAPAYQKADELKERTVTTSKQVTKELTRRIGECARSIKFENAYCISLKEHFDNNPDSKRTLDTHYPWIIEIGIKPKKVTVTGEQVASLVAAGTEFTLF